MRHTSKVVAPQLLVFAYRNFRLMIKQDQEILRAIPEEQVARRAELQHTIDVRIDELINAIATGRSLREEATAYKGNWRDVVLFFCVALFTFVWWNVPHSKINWLLTSIVLSSWPQRPPATPCAARSEVCAQRSAAVTIHRERRRRESRRRTRA